MGVQLWQELNAKSSRRVCIKSTILVKLPNQELDLPWTQLVLKAALVPELALALTFAFAHAFVPPHAPIFACTFVPMPGCLCNLFRALSIRFRDLFCLVSILKASLPPELALAELAFAFGSKFVPPFAATLACTFVPMPRCLCNLFRALCIRFCDLFCLVSILKA